jgi:microcystin-dependent protein
MATTNYSWNLPTVGGSEDTWGTQLNSNWSDLDTLLGGTNATEFAILDGATVTTAELNILDGVTASTAEINILDGVTASTSEINILDGVTATTTEINYLSGVTSNIQTQLANSVPAGAVMSFAMSSAPSGWLKANGAAVSRATYATLFAAIGTTFGAGDGSTTFNLPDMRGEFPRGWDDARGVDSGRVFGSAQSQSTQDLYAQVTRGPSERFRLREISTPTWTANQFDDDVGFSGSATQTSGAGIGALGTGETRPRNIALLYCIKT